MKVLRNGFWLIPFANSFRAADELVEWDKEGTHSFDAAKLMPKLASKFVPVVQVVP
jgi:hypothetical protein